MQDMCQKWGVIHFVGNLVCMKEDGDPQGYKGKQEPGPTGSTQQTEQDFIHRKQGVTINGF